MTVRKPTTAEYIENLKVEMFNRKESLERLVSKLEREGFLSDDERELAISHTLWINRNKDIIRNFYKPAMVIEE